MRKILFCILFLFNCLAIKAQEDLGPIHWISFEEAERLDSTENRPFLIDVYTDWCGWCKRMMATTFQHPQLAEYINKNFYCVRFDAETSDTIKFQGKQWVSDGRVNSLARHFLGDRMSYPTIVYIDRKKNIIPIPGYQDIKNIQPFLVYFTEDLSETVSLEEFDVEYKTAYYSTNKEEIDRASRKIDTTGTINWVSLNDLPKLMEKSPKPIMIDLYLDEKYRGYIPYCTANSIIHERVQMREKRFCDYVNEHFYAVRMEATTRDTVYWFDPKHEHPFVSTGVGMPNSFTTALMNDDFKFPALFFFDKEHMFVAKTGDFFGMDFWLVILKYYATEAYKEKTFQTFYKENVK